MVDLSRRQLTPGSSIQGRSLRLARAQRGVGRRRWPRRVPGPVLIQTQVLGVARCRSVCRQLAGKHSALAQVSNSAAANDSSSRTLFFWYPWQGKLRRPMVLAANTVLQAGVGSVTDLQLGQAARLGCR